MSQTVSKTVIKLMTSLLVACSYVIVCFGGQGPLLTNLFLDGTA